jgi:hypothetical protein
MSWVNINMPLYRRLVAEGLSEADAERWAVLAPTLRLPALFDALVSAGCPPEKRTPPSTRWPTTPTSPARSRTAVGSWLTRLA